MKKKNQTITGAFAIALGVLFIAAQNRVIQITLSVLGAALLIMAIIDFVEKEFSDYDYVLADCPSAFAGTELFDNCYNVIVVTNCDTASVRCTEMSTGHPHPSSTTIKKPIPIGYRFFYGFGCVGT